jgi:EmrB/QacA subfamily drug resistance transporter
VPAGPGTIEPALYARRWKIVAVLCLSLMIVMIGNSSVNVALPVLARDLHASASTLQWITDAYTLCFAGTLFAAGSIGDRFGRRATLQTGLTVLLFAAAAAAWADSADLLIAARAIMGAAAAFVMPSTLSILTNVFPVEERTRAIGVWAGVAAGGSALGPAVSGFVLERFWWGSAFLVNVPLILLALIAGRLIVPESKDPQPRPVDLGGLVLSALSIGTLVYGIIEAPRQGWTSPPSLAAFGIAFLAAVLFVHHELVARDPMLDLRLLRDRRFTVAAGAIALAYFALFGTMFLVTQYLQLVAGYTPLQAGLTSLPMSVAMMTLAPQVPRLVRRVGAARVVPLGLGAVSVALVGFSQLGVRSASWAVIGCLLLLGIGISATGAPLTAVLMSSVPTGRAGIGSAMNDASRELGGALGVAILGSLLTSRYSAALWPALTGLTGTARQTADSGLAGALNVAHHLPASTSGALTTAAKAAFVHGLKAATLSAASLALCAATAIFFLLPTDQPLPLTSMRDSAADHRHSRRSRRSGGGSEAMRSYAGWSSWLQATRR